MCAYYRYYYPLQFITSFLNNAANEEDVSNGAKLAKLYGIEITSPKYGLSGSKYFCDAERGVISKGLGSIKYIGEKLANDMYELSRSRNFDSFTDLICALKDELGIDSRSLDLLIKIDFFSEFGNQRELENIVRFWNQFKKGTAKKIKRSDVDGTFIENVVRKHSTWLKKNGEEAASYTLDDPMQILRELESKVKSMHIPDWGILTKVRNYIDVVGYMGFVTGREEDRRLLYIRDIYPVKRKRDGKRFGVSILTQSVGSGVEARFTMFDNAMRTCNMLYKNPPELHKGDIIKVMGWHRDGQYFTLDAYKFVRCDNDIMEELEDEDLDECCN